MLDKAMKEVNKRSKNLKGMIERSEEMIPRKDGVLSPKKVWTKSSGETKKILGNSLKNKAMSNKYLEDVKEVLGDHL
jgi:regulatory protein YycH of two-component signal transduction system YycFG